MNNLEMLIEREIRDDFKSSGFSKEYYVESMEMIRNKKEYMDSGLLDLVIELDDDKVLCLSDIEENIVYGVWDRIKDSL